MRVVVLLAICCLTVSKTWSASSFDELAAQAKTAREANQLPQAIELYKQALQLNSKWEEGWWFLGTLLYDTGQFAGGRDALHQVVDLDPKFIPAWGFLGLCEFETREYTQALKDVEHALASNAVADPQVTAVLRYHEALLLTRTGQFDRAVEKYAWFVRNATPNTTILTSLGLAALRMPLLPKELDADQQQLCLMAGRATALTLTGDIKSAQSAYATLLDRYPKATNVHYLHGYLLLGANPEVAIQEFEKELQITPGNPDAEAMLAWALVDRGEPASAVPYAEKAAAARQDSEVAQYICGRALAETGDLKGGIEHLEIAERLDPKNLQPHVSLATAYSRAGRPEEARHEREVSLELAEKSGSLVQP